MDPFVAVRAEGPWLFDEDGSRTLDGSGSWWCNNLGHGHPRLREALIRQAETLMHCSLAGTTHAPAALLARELVEVAPPGLERVFFSDNGSTAVEIALKIAFQFWQQNGRPERTRFLALPGAYHGDTLGVMSVGAVDAFSGVFAPLMFETLRGPEPGEDLDFSRTIDAMIRTLEEEGDSLAGVVVEPLVQGASGMRTWPASELKRLHEATRAADTFFIADEVFTGFGRTGTMWACDQAGITPDLLCTAKGLTGGMLPFAATLATARVYDGFRGDKSRCLMHGHTFCGNPLGAALALEVLAIYREEDVLGAAKKNAAILASGFEAIGEIKGVRRTRSLGMVAAADLGEGGYFGELGWRVHDEARARGAFIRPLGDTVYVVPMLTASRADLESLVDIVHRSIEASLGAS